MRIWRRLQHLGAIPLKQAVYVLPDTPNAREDFEWLKTEVKAAGGDASVFAADSVDAWSDDALVEEFSRSRQDAYAALVRESRGSAEAGWRAPGDLAARARPPYAACSTFSENVCSPSRRSTFSAARGAIASSRC